MEGVKYDYTKDLDKVVEIIHPIIEIAPNHADKVKGNERNIPFQKGRIHLFAVKKR